MAYSLIEAAEFDHIWMKLLIHSQTSMLHHWSLGMDSNFIPHIIMDVSTHIHAGIKLNTLRPRQDGRHFPGDIFKCIFLTNISLKFLPKGPINNIPALVQIMVWLWPGDEPLSESMLVSFLMHICLTRPQWVNPCIHVVKRGLMSFLCIYLCVIQLQSAHIPAGI